MTVSMHMPYQTPVGGNRIDELEGDGADITARGIQVSELGKAMEDAWKLIARLVDDGAEMEGDAVEKLREVAEDVNADLRKGGELYTAVGPHIEKYGSAVGASKPTLDSLASDLRETWQKYYYASEYARAAGLAVPNVPDSDAEPSEQYAYDTAAQNAQDAQDTANGHKANWDDYAAQYDREYNTWFNAYEEAVREIRSGISGKIEDSWKDDVRGALDALADILAVAGLVLAVLAIIVGGPIVMALAAAVAVLTLLTQVAKFAVGDGDWFELSLAIVGCVPFIGPGFKFFKGLAQGSSGFPGFLGALKTALKTDAFRLAGVGAGSPAAWLRGLNDLAGATPAAKAGEFVTEFFSGKGITEWGTMGARGIDALDTVSTVWATKLGIVGNIKSAADGTFGNFFDPDQNRFS
ncbi:hypothetical protein JF531_08195 [Microbacterium esteraromaticum]|uniref:hypothetical protein n=1 Tax=Microbacterium esteraromaticum TaxID=57043 RepID=UPI001A8E4D21|nr:hypothetical protein [Microbacterium esteraromaticum]MBN8424498.1 hypothetical protein [Microbacterium esteraromaticum]